MMRRISVCYNPAMNIRHPLVLGAVLFLLSGCSSLGNYADPSASGSPQLTYAQVKAEPNSFTGQPITLGGKVLKAKRLKDGTRLEILQLPLNASLRPTNDLSKSQGRFIAMRREFLDPATVPPGTFVTVTGEAAGSVTLPLDETDYTYPLMTITNVRVWPNHEEEEPPRIRPYHGYGPYWGPYWSPWGPWPYYW